LCIDSNSDRSIAENFCETGQFTTLIASNPDIMKTDFLSIAAAVGTIVVLGAIYVILFRKVKEHRNPDSGRDSDTTASG